MQNIRGGQIWVQINPIRFWVNQVGKNLNSIWTCNQIRIIFGSDRIKNFGLSSVEQAAAAVLVANGASCSRSCQRITTAWVGAAAELASVRQWLALCAHVGHVRWRCCVCCRVVTADWLCVCVWWEVRCVYVVIGYDCVFVWWVVCCVLCVRVVIGFTFLFQTIFF